MRSPEPSHLSASVAYLVVLAAPPLAWLLWVSWSQGKASDQAHVAWVGTVGFAAVLAGSWCRRRWWHVIGLTLLGTASAVVTLYLWWSSQESDGLFMIGIALFTPLALVAAPLLVKVGMYVGARRRRPGTGRPRPGRAAATEPPEAQVRA